MHVWGDAYSVRVMDRRVMREVTFHPRRKKQREQVRGKAKKASEGKAREGRRREKQEEGRGRGEKQEKKRKRLMKKEKEKNRQGCVLRWIFGSTIGPVANRLQEGLTRWREKRTSAH